MKISVVIPVYNAERFVRYPLDSVLAQTHSDWECICVDDGSTDGSGAILDEYAAKDARFRVVHQANGGEGAARNAGMDLATGEIVAFLDADDTWHPEALRLIAATREATGADVIRYGWRAVDGHDGGFEPVPAVVGKAVDLAARTESTIRFCALGAATAVSRAATSGSRRSPRAPISSTCSTACCVRARSPMSTRRFSTTLRTRARSRAGFQRGLFLAPAGIFLRLLRGARSLANARRPGRIRGNT